MYKLIFICAAVFMIVGCSKPAESDKTQPSETPATASPSADASKDNKEAVDEKKAENNAPKQEEIQVKKEEPTPKPEEEYGEDGDMEEDEEDEDYSVPQDGTIEEKMASLKWENDSNGRFDFDIEYPSFMKCMPGSDNGDGMEYKWKDVTYVAWGEWADGNIKTNYDLQVKFLGHEPKYKVVKDNYFIISDFDKDGNIFYRKTYKRDDVNITIQVTYPQAYKQAMDPIVKKIANYKPNPGEPTIL